MEHPLVWIDLEMTGLDPDTDVIVEIATIVTDGALERIVEGPDLVVHAPEEQLQRMGDTVRQMHADSGLLEAIRGSTMDVRAAEDATLRFIREHVPEAGDAPMAGNSIHTDRMFLRRHMPALHGYLHYRNVDVSTLKELARRWYPAALEAAPDKQEGHRALADIRESIEELRHYRRAIMR